MSTAIPGTIALRRTPSLRILMGCLLCGVSSIALANPTDGVVVGGTATITETGSTLDVVQHTDRAVIDWRSFDIGVDEHTRFTQPGANSVALNRVNSNDPSRIMGKLSANGNIILVNPNGVFFGRDSKVDVNGIVATTADIATDKFMAGDQHFDKPGNPDAVIENQGNITAKQAGLVGLVAPNVVNSGTISAKLGRVQLASGDTVTLDMYGDGLLEVKASDALTTQLVDHRGVITAEGGTIALTAAAARQVVNSTIKVTGELRAPSVGQQAGKIVIAAEGTNAVIDNAAAEKGKKSGASTVLISGKLDVTSDTGKGGTVEITGDRIALLEGTRIDASGATGGGVVHVGGEYLGKGETPTALHTIIQEDVVVKANATVNGHGGEVIMYADQRTEFGGEIQANGEGDGDGGFVETSGRVALLSYGRVYATTRRGRQGTWLLDPADVSIVNSTTANATGDPNWTATGTGSQISAASIKASLDNNINVTITTSNDGYAGNGDISVNAAITTTGTGSLTLSAYRNIGVNASITLQGGSLTLQSNNNNTNIGSIIINQAIATHGGAVTLGGGSNLAAGYATGYSGYSPGIYLVNTINAGSGAITLRGKGSTAGNSGFGVYIDAGGKLITSGAITVTGVGSSAGDYTYGVALANGAEIRNTGAGITTITGTGISNGVYTAGVFVSASTVTGTSGAVNIIGTGSSTPGATYGMGVVVTGGTIHALGASAITITGIKGSGANSVGLQINGSGNAIGGASATGAITLVADSMNFAGLTLTTTNSLTIKNDTAGVTIGVGSGGNLSISNTALGYFNAGSYIFGSSTSGNVIINTSHDFGGSGVTFISGNDITHNGAYASTSTGSLTLSAQRNIVVNGSITLQGGSLTLRSNHAGAADGSTGSGAIRIGNTLATNGGDIILGGGGGTITTGSGFAVGNSVYREGIRISSNIDAGGGAIIMNGKGFIDSANSNYGIRFYSGVTQTSGAITLTGRGGGSGVSGDNIGVLFPTSGATVKTTGSAAFIITGYAGGENGSGMLNFGVQSGGTALQASGTGSITINGYGAANAGTGNLNYGFNGGGVVANGGTLTINGYGAIAGGNSNYGMFITSSITNTNGAIVLNGVAGTGTTGVGIRMNAGTISAGSGIITLTGVHGTGGGAPAGININGTAVIGGAGQTGAIQLLSDRLTLSAGTFQTSDSLTIANRTAGVAVDVGTATSGGTAITNAVLNLLDGGSYIFGSATSGDVTINTTKDFGDKNVTFISGNDINIAGNLARTGSGNITYRLTANRDIYNTNSAGISLANANLILNADADQATVLGGAIYLTGGTFDIGTGTLTMGGGADATGYAYGRAGRVEGIKLDGTVVGANTALIMRGHGYDSGSAAHGISFVNGAKSSKYTTMTGVGGGGGTDSGSHGVYVAGTNSSIGGTGTAQITVHGVAGTGSGGGHYGIYVDVANGIYLSNTASTTVLRADSLYAGGASHINARGTITIAPYSDIGMSFGGAVANTLNLSDTFLARLGTASAYIFGATTTATGAPSTGDITINSAANTGDIATTFISGNDIFLNGTLTKATGTGTASYQFLANRHITTASGIGIVTASGGINLTLDADYDNNGSGIITLNANGINTGAGSMTLNDATTLIGNVSLTGTGVTLNGTVNGTTAGTSDLTVDAGTGTFTNNGVIGGVNKLKDLSISADDMALNAALNGSGILTLQQGTNTQQMRVGGSYTGTLPGYLTLNTSEIGHIAEGWSQINLGRTDTVATKYLLVGTSTWNDAVAFRGWVTTINGNINQQKTGASVTFGGSLGMQDSGAASSVTTLGGDIVITGQYFARSGATPMTLTTNGGAFNAANAVLYNNAGDTSISTNGGGITLAEIRQNSATATTNTSFDAGTGTVTMGSINTASNVIIKGSTLTLNGPIGNSTALNQISLTGSNSITLPSITANTIFVRTTGAAARLVRVRRSRQQVSAMRWCWRRGATLSTTVAARHLALLTGAGWSTRPIRLPTRAAG